jgi:hypothetical protein
MNSTNQENPLIQQEQAAQSNLAYNLAQDQQQRASIPQEPVRSTAGDFYSNASGQQAYQAQNQAYAQQVQGNTAWNQAGGTPSNAGTQAYQVQQQANLDQARYAQANQRDQYAAQYQAAQSQLAQGQAQYQAAKQSQSQGGEYLTSRPVVVESGGGSSYADNRAGWQQERSTNTPNASSVAQQQAAPQSRVGQATSNDRFAGQQPMQQRPPVSAQDQAQGQEMARRANQEQAAKLQQESQQAQANLGQAKQQVGGLRQQFAAQMSQKENDARQIKTRLLNNHLSNKGEQRRQQAQQRAQQQPQAQAQVQPQQPAQGQPQRRM